MIASKRLTLGLDVDGILYDWHSVFRFLAIHQFGIDLPPVEEMWSSYGGDVEFITPGQRQWLWTEGVKRGLFRYGHLYKGSVEALRELATFVDLVVLTHRPTGLHTEISDEAYSIGMTDTLDWLAYLRVPFAQVHILPKTTRKSSIQCHAYIDDSPEVINDLETYRPHSRIILWDRPWNRDTAIMPGTLRVSSWGEVIDSLRRESLRVAALSSATF